MPDFIRPCIKIIAQKTLKIDKMNLGRG